MQRRVWQCRAICGYRKYPCTTGAFSHDGSILALAFGATTTLWDPFTNTLLHTLLHHPKDKVTNLSFLANSAYLVTSSGQNVVVWDLLTLQVWWTHSMDVHAIAIQPQSTRIVVAVKASTQLEKRKRDADSTPRSGVP